MKKVTMTIKENCSTIIWKIPVKSNKCFTGIFCQRIFFKIVIFAWREYFQYNKFYYLISLICQNPAFCKILPKLSPKKVTTRLYNTTPLRKIRKVWLDRDRHGNLFTPSCFRPFPFGLGEVLTKKWPGHWMNEFASKLLLKSSETFLVLNSW